MTTQEAIKWIEESNGKIIGIRFVKRTDGTIREMNCRLGVKKYLKGGEKAYDAKEKGLITVFDMQKKGYRSIPTENILAIVIGGEWKEVKEA